MIDLFSKLAAGFTRREGRKFLKLQNSINESILTDSNNKKKTETSLYIHIPFCRTLCPFCCFNRYLFKEDRARLYFKLLKRELSFYIDRGFRFSDFYFGGGTPTILMDELLSFINFLRNNLDVRKISLETTPNEITKENLILLKEAGINRLSVGIQSFNSDIVKAMGRVQCSGEEAKQKVMEAQGRFDTLNIDFVFNFPFQTLQQFESDIAIFKDMNIDQATFYPLMASPHKKDAMERKYNRVNTSREHQFYDIILQKLFDCGYKASTAWCFSKGEKMIDEYIIDYDDYIGIGSGSVSIFDGNFFVNSFSLDKYQQLIETDKFPIIGWRKLSERENTYYYLLTKLFGMCLDTEKFKTRFNASINQKLDKELFVLKTLDLIRGREKLEVTRKGMFPVGVMMREFFTSLNNLRELYIENQV